MSRTTDRIVERLAPRKWGRKEPHWLKTVVSTISMAAAVGTAGLAVWRYIQDNPNLFRANRTKDEEGQTDYDGPFAPDVPPPTAN